MRAKVSIIIGGKERWQSVRNGVEATWRTGCLSTMPPARLSAVRLSTPCSKNARPSIALSRLRPKSIPSGCTPGILRAKSSTDRSWSGLGPRNCSGDRRFWTHTRFRPISPRPPTDEAMLVQRMGIPVGIASGDPANFKITTPTDLSIAEALLAYRQKM